MEPLPPPNEPHHPEQPFLRASTYFPGEIDEAMPVRPRKRVAIVENRGAKDLYEDSFAMSHLVQVGDKGV